MAETKQVTATMQIVNIEAAQQIATKERRSFSETIDMLVEEAIAARNPKKKLLKTK